jgi:large subunit ribosomal protein L20
MHKKAVLKLAAGFRGRAGNCIRIARERVERALQYATRDRRAKKRDVRGLWIARINAGAREHGVRSLGTSIEVCILFSLCMNAILLM